MTGRQELEQFQHHWASHSHLEEDDVLPICNCTICNCTILRQIHTIVKETQFQTDDLSYVWAGPAYRKYWPRECRSLCWLASGCHSLRCPLFCCCFSCSSVSVFLVSLVWKLLLHHWLPRFVRTIFSLPCDRTLGVRPVPAPLGQPQPLGRR